MINPISSGNGSSGIYPETHAQAIKPKQSKNFLQSARDKVDSPYYQSSLQSMTISDVPAAETNRVAAVVENKKSVFVKVQNWFCNLFGYAKSEPVVTDLEVPLQGAIDSAPTLPPPEDTGNRESTKTFIDLNRELVTRLKNMAEFEEEMRNLDSARLDKLIFKMIIECSLKQKALKEDSSLSHQLELLNLHKGKKSLQQTYYSIADDIAACAKTSSTLRWIRIGSTAGITGAIAITFATGGASAVLSAAAGLLSIAKGGITLSEGILKYKNDKKTGDLFIINQEIKSHSTRMNDHLTTIQTHDEEIGNLLKTIKKHLENLSKAERASFSRTSA